MDQSNSWPPKIEELQFPEREMTMLRMHSQSFERHKHITTRCTLFELCQGDEKDFYWGEGLEHDELVSHIQETDECTDPAGKFLRIIFVDRHEDPDVQVEAISLSTIAWLYRYFGVSLAYLTELVTGHSGKTNLHRYRDNCGKLRKSEYSLCGYWHATYHQSNTTTYITHKSYQVNCTDFTKINIKRLIESPACGKLFESLMVDCLIMNGYLDAADKELSKQIEPLIRAAPELNATNHSRRTPQRTDIRNVYRDSYLARRKLLSTTAAYSILQNDLETSISWIEEAYDVTDAHGQLKKTGLAAIKRRIHNQMPYLSYYKQIVDSEIEKHYFELQQLDSQSNLEIAQISTIIAGATKRDSASLIVLAAITMFFLPGTFISTFLSMPFFDVRSDGMGHYTLLVEGHWWIFFAMSVPLTSIVFAAWWTWMQRRDIRNSTDDKAADESWYSSDRI